ncbi:MAG: hypothetical protein CSA70_07150 [Rhodobacterales bacterium]|nr:MAG: hypothetical protein CSA70_07150 [Rhodobacterales bacterium]
MRLFLLLSLTLLSSCARPLSEHEKAFASQLHGESLDLDRIRFHNGALVGEVTYRRQKRPRLTCRERIWPEPTSEMVTVGPAAVALHNRVFFAKPYFSKDFLDTYPARLPLFQAMLFAHEITHVWQWQNRHKTGYSPLRAAREHTYSDDPYLFDINTKTAFLDYGYEQQASIVEEYVCCAALDPGAPRTKRLERLIKSEIPMQTLRISPEIRIPWAGARVQGICR